jgi:hypothetical protein
MAHWFSRGKEIRPARKGKQVMTYATLLQIIIRNGGVDGPAAKRVADWYRKRKLVKYNAHDGYHAIHGGLFERAAIVTVAAVTADIIRWKREGKKGK